MDFIAACLMVLAFAVAGWKIFNRLPSADFATWPQQKALQSAPASNISEQAESASLSQQLSPDGRFRFSAQFVSGAPGQAVHAASIVELRNGGLRAVWFSGSREGAGDVTIQTAVMDAASMRWQTESTLFDRQKLERGLWRYVKKLGNPVIARAPDGSLSLWLVNVSLGGWAGSAVTWSRSVDEGASWSVPKRLVTSPFLNISTLVKSAPVPLADGQVYLPVYHEFVTKFAEVLRLSADGQVVDKIRIPGSRSSLQPVLLVDDAQKAQIFMRSSHGGFVTASATGDAGRTWSDTRITSWPNPDSALAGVVTSGAMQWLALNPTSAGRGILAMLQAPKGGIFDGALQWIVEPNLTSATRHPAGLSMSNYELALGQELQARGTSQVQAQSYVASAKRQLCSADNCAQEFSYPYLLQTSDGFIHLVYTWHRTRIRHVRFDPRQTALASGPVATHASSNN